MKSNIELYLTGWTMCSVGCFYILFIFYFLVLLFLVHNIVFYYRLFDTRGKTRDTTMNAEEMLKAGERLELKQQRRQERKPLNKYIFYGTISLLIGGFLFILGYWIGNELGIKEGIRIQEEYIRNGFILIKKI